MPASSTPESAPAKPAPGSTSGQTDDSGSAPAPSDSAPASDGAEQAAGEKNALASAKGYLGFTPFSHDGLIGQLEFEGYTTAEATYAVENCGADWDE